MDTAKSAVLSEDGRYRFELTRTWSDGGASVCWIMLNPSTADANVDDATIRKCIGFSKHWGYDSLAVVNLFAYRTTYPGELETAENIVGPDNNLHILSVVGECDRTVAAWGAWGALYGRGHAVSALVPTPLYCLGTTLTGHPRHPGRIGYDTPLVVWEG